MEKLFVKGDYPRTIPLEEDTVQIGRSSSNDVVLSDPISSRNHCEIRREEDRFVLEDLNSSNGTFVNGNQITQHTLSKGDKIQIGKTLLFFGKNPSTSKSSAKSSSPSPEQEHFQQFHAYQDIDRSFTRVLYPVLLLLFGLSPLFFLFSTPPLQSNTQTTHKNSSSLQNHAFDNQKTPSSSPHNTNRNGEKNQNDTDNIPPPSGQRQIKEQRSHSSSFSPRRNNLTRHDLFQIFDEMKKHNHEQANIFKRDIQRLDNATGN